jgi:hypothetical protein
MKIFFKRNGATLLTIVASGGVVLTSVLAAVATPKAMRLVYRAEAEKGEDLTKLEKIRAGAPAYVPAAIAATSTIACIFGANVLNRRNQAALASAYMLLDSTYKKYRDKVEELYGEGSDRRVLEEVAKDDFDQDEISVHDETRLFCDVTSMRYFELPSEKVQEAEDELNKKLITSGYACVNDFYEYLGIPKTDYGDKLGWSTYTYGRYYDGCNYIEFYHHPVVLDDGLECCLIHFVDEPSLDYKEY